MNGIFTKIIKARDKEDRKTKREKDVYLLMK